MVGRLLWVALAAGVGLLALAARRLARRARHAPRGQSAIVRCPLHGIAYDVELEECPDCARAHTDPASRRPPVTASET